MVEPNQEQIEEAIEIAELVQKGVDEEIKREGGLLEVLEADIADLEAVKQEAKQKISDEGNNVEGDLNEIREDLGRIHNAIKTVYGKLGEIEETKTHGNESPLTQGDGSEYPVLKGEINIIQEFEEEVLADLKDIKEDLDDIRARVKMEEGAVADEVRNLHMEVQEFENLLQVIMQNRNDIQKAVRTETELLMFAEEYGVPQIEQVLNNQDDVGKAEQLENEIEEKEEKIEQELRSAEGILDKEVKLDREVINHIEQLEQMIQKVESELEKFGNVVPEIDHNANVEGEHKALKELWGLIRDTENHLDEFRQFLDAIEEEIGEEAEMESQEEQEVEEGLEAGAGLKEDYGNN